MSEESKTTEFQTTGFRKDIKSARSFFLEHTADVNLKWFCIGLALGILLVLLRGLLFPLLLSAFVLYIVFKFLAEAAGGADAAAPANTRPGARTAAANTDLPVRERAQITPVTPSETRTPRESSKEQRRYRPPKPSKKTARAGKASRSSGQNEEAGGSVPGGRTPAKNASGKAERNNRKSKARSGKPRRNSAEPDSRSAAEMGSRSGERTHRGKRGSKKKARSRNSGAQRK